LSKGIKLAAVLATGALALAACGSSSSAGSSGSASPSASKIDFKACMVSDAGGFDDRSFNQTGYEGLKKAEAELGVEVVALESKTDADYTSNINQAVSQGCNLVITVGFLLGDATEKAATANPDTEFAIVDYAYEKPRRTQGPRLRHRQSSFLAGIAAAGTSKSGIVATYGGLQIPSVTAFMTGFYQGVEYYNKENGKSVKVLGWTRPTRRRAPTRAASTTRTRASRSRTTSSSRVLT
jgi:basic membrane protein A